jgi:hypothetical protein
MPDLVESPDQLAGANTLSTTVDNAGIFAGPALGGVLVATTSTEATFLATAVAMLLASIAISRVGGSSQSDAESSKPDESAFRMLTAGLSASISDPSLRLLLGTALAQTLSMGGLNVFVVVIALEVADMGEAGVGALNAALGIGGLLGGVAALPFVDGPIGGALAAMGVLSAPGAVLAGACLIGVVVTVNDVAGITLLQRATPDHVRGRVFGVLEGLIWGGIGLGGVIASGLIALAGTEAAMISMGTSLPVLTLLTWPLVRRLDQQPMPDRDWIATLRRTRVFAPLAYPTLENLAAHARPLHFGPGETIVREGEPGNDFFVISAGQVDVFEGDDHVRVQGAGDYFGEIALLHADARTATVRARGQVEVLVLAGDVFRAAVLGHPRAREIAEGAISARLGITRAEVASA